MAGGYYARWGLETASKARNVWHTGLRIRLHGLERNIAGISDIEACLIHETTLNLATLPLIIPLYKDTTLIPISVAIAPLFHGPHIPQCLHSGKRSGCNL